jgi:hypothetical protein
MQRTGGDKWDGLYEYSVPRRHFYYVCAYHNVGNITSRLIAWNNTGDLHFPNLIRHGGINLALHFDIDSQNLTARTGIHLDGTYPTRDTNLPFLLERYVYSTKTDYVSGLNTQSARCDYAECFFRLPITEQNSGLDYPIFVKFNSSGINVNKIPLKLFGNSTRFPFDDYYVNLVLAIPFKNITVLSITPSFSNLLNASWHAGQIQNSSIGPENIGLPYYTPGPDHEKQYVFPDSYITTSVPAIYEPHSISQRINNTSFLDVKVPFYRSNTMITIVLPLISIFYLLGAIPILGNTADQIAIRVTITIGIFAFLFAFTPIINSMKPAVISSKVPTVADFLVTIIIVATIAYTISSVIGGSPIMAKRSSMTAKLDPLVYVLIAGITVYQCTVYPFDITVRLVPIVLFGLGYGLLFRINRQKLKRYTNLRT